MAILHVAQNAMPEVHGTKALHASLQVAIDGAAVREGFVHQILLVALFALFGQYVQAAGGTEMGGSALVDWPGTHTAGKWRECNMQHAACNMRLISIWGALLVGPRHFFHYENRPGARHYLIVLAEEIRAEAEQHKASWQELGLFPHAATIGACKVNRASE